MRVYVARITEKPFRAFVAESPQSLDDFCNQSTYGYIFKNNSRDLSITWSVLPGHWEGKKSHPIGSIYRFPGKQNFILTQECKEVLDSILSKYGDFLPLTIDGRVSHYIYNMTAERLNALDSKRSKCSYPYGTVYVHSFIGKAIDGVHIFRVPESPDYYISDQLKDIIQRNNFFGLDFFLVWDGEDPDFHDERYERAPWVEMRNSIVTNQQLKDASRTE